MATQNKLTAQQTARMEQAAIVRTIGARMKAAREMCNMSQLRAAESLGYKNSSKLSKVEGATDTLSVPLRVIRRASEVYEVSIDYLFGALDDWERGARMTQEREVSRWMFAAWDEAHKRDMEVLRALHDRLEAMSGVIAAMVDAGAEANAALTRFAELNPEFDDMRAGSRLVASVERVAGAAGAAKAKMARFRIECKAASVSNTQLKLL